MICFGSNGIANGSLNLPEEGDRSSVLILIIARLIATI